MRVAESLTFEEARKMGVQLGLKPKVIKKVSKRNENATDRIFAMEILLRYRGKRPYASQILTIVKALKEIDRADLAEFFPE